MAPGRTTQHGGILSVEIPCRACGRPIVMVAGDETAEIADRAAFLLVHQHCLIASVPEQRPDERPELRPERLVP